MIMPAVIMSLSEKNCYFCPMGEVIRPWHFRARSYQKWQIENKRAKEAHDAALRARGIDPSDALRAARRARWRAAVQDWSMERIKLYKSFRRMAATSRGSAFMPLSPCCHCLEARRLRSPACRCFPAELAPPDFHGVRGNRPSGPNRRP